MDDIKLPTDLQVNMMLVHQEYLSQRYDQLVDTLKVHHIALQVLFVVVGFTGGIMIAKKIQERKKANG